MPEFFIVKITSFCYKSITPLTLKYNTQKNKKQHTISTGIPRPLWVMPVGYPGMYFIRMEYSVLQFFG